IERQISPALSLHEWSAADSLTAMQLTGRMPRDVVVIGVEPERVSWDTRLSATIQSRLPQIISVVLKEIQASKLAGRN
ncbi:MAG: hypothetical protein N3E40_06925, partial [Dehalococcoidia bacterium]|nr:hypothetical protein [Dehalococcoidia bacterium]